MTRPPIEHDLKLMYPGFDDVARGIVTHQVRLRDRDYRAGDTLRLREWRADWNQYTGRQCYRVITHVMRLNNLGVPHLVALSIADGISADGSPFYHQNRDFQ